MILQCENDGKTTVARLVGLNILRISSINYRPVLTPGMLTRGAANILQDQLDNQNPTVSHHISRREYPSVEKKEKKRKRNMFWRFSNSTYELGPTARKMPMLPSEPAL